MSGESSEWTKNKTSQQCILTIDQNIDKQSVQTEIQNIDKESGMTEIQKIRAKYNRAVFDSGKCEMKNDNEHKLLEETITRALLALDKLIISDENERIERKQLVNDFHKLSDEVMERLDEEKADVERKKNKDGARWFLRVNIRGTIVIALFDPGANRSFMSDSLFKIMKSQKNAVYSINEETVVANGIVEVVTSAMSVPMQIGHKGTLYLVRHLPSLPYELVIGMDIIRSMEIDMNSLTDEWHYLSDPDITYKFILENELQSAKCFGLQSLTNPQKEILNKLLENAKSMEPEGFPPTELMQHEIKLTDYTPIVHKPRPVNPKMQMYIDEEVDSMLVQDIIEPSESSWSHPILMVPKPDGTHRPCIDFRELNKVTVKDKYPLPNMSSILNNLKHCRYLSKIDLTKAFWLIPLTENCKHFTAFSVPHKGFYQWKRLPFGTVNSSSVFQRLIDYVLKNDLEPYLYRYVDDVIIATETFEHMMEILSIVFERLREANLKVNWTKSEFGVSSLEYLGFIVDEHGLHANKKKTECITNYPRPKNVRQLRRILGMITWYKKFIPNLSEKTKPLTKLLCKKERWSWTEEQEKAFEELKTTLISPPILSRPDWSQEEFIIESDASLSGLGCVLLQEINGERRIIEYASRSLTRSERNYSVTELECLGILFALKKYRPYIEGGYRIRCRTDHRSLTWLMNLRNPTARLQRWVVQLMVYDLVIEYKKGSENHIPDALSRAKNHEDEEDVSSNHPNETSCSTLLGTKKIDEYLTWYEGKYKNVKEKPEENPSYEIKDNLLYYYKLNPIDVMLETDQKRSWKLVPDPKYLEKIFKENHDELQAGHPGIIRTFDNISMYYFWPGMFQDVAKYVRSCETCQRSKPLQQKPAGRMCSKSIPKVGEVWYSDLSGPYPISSNQNKYLLVFQDQFSKYVVIIPLRQATANTVSKNFVKEILYKFGKPRKLITDNGSQYASNLMNDLAKQYGFEHQRIPPYSPHINIVERANKTIKQLLRAYVDEQQRKWDEYIPEFAFAINSSTQMTTGYSPNLLMFGREIEPVLHLRRSIENDTDGNIEPNYPQTVKKQELLEDLYELVRRNQLKATRQQAVYYDKHHNIKVSYTVGDKVLRKNFRQSNANEHYSNKIDHIFVGPYVIAGVVSPVIYTLANVNGEVEGNYHIKDIKKYHN